MDVQTHFKHVLFITERLSGLIVLNKQPAKVGIYSEEMYREAKGKKC